MKTIHKFAVTENDLNTDGLFSFDAPAGARVLLVAAQVSLDVLPTIWLEIEPSDAIETYTFAVVGDGRRVPEGFEYAGSAVCANGSLVWHIYEGQ